MTTELRLTVPEVVDSIQRTTGKRYSHWTVRRVIDGLDSAGEINVQRCGLYRTVASSDVARIAEAAAERMDGRESRTLASEAAR